MAIEYTLDNRLSIIGPLMNEYQLWHEKLLLQNFYEADQKITPPQECLKWLQNVSLESINIDERYSVQKQQLVDLHTKLIKSADCFEKAPQQEDLVTFNHLLRGYLMEFQAFAQSIILENWGLDNLTGLKNNAVMKKELQIEMERFSREGYPFCIGLARIDDFKAIDDALGADQADTIIKTVGQFIKDSLRTYDDAYRVNRDHFIMCLKQSDMMGGQKALERLRDILEKAGEVYNLKGEPRMLSLSCCVAAPFPGDEIDDLIDNLYVDLDKQIKDHGAVLTYQELSPLQRFMREEGE